MAALLRLAVLPCTPSAPAVMTAAASQTEDLTKRLVCRLLRALSPFLTFSPTVAAAISHEPQFILLFAFRANRSSLMLLERAWHLQENSRGVAGIQEDRYPPIRLSVISTHLVLQARDQRVFGALGRTTRLLSLARASIRLVLTLQSTNNDDEKSEGPHVAPGEQTPDLMDVGEQPSRLVIVLIKRPPGEKTFQIP
ncbi:hypothetical protein BDP55DRAFT_129774 [Colletotrichum godetiae]|uniref:Secreted protein n=1 Tax=Colletotrichum godetiae TaxID=1209918 RepID=A0AAJ0AY06_9PEZI|nr:uncharacterized protein BDP55DRAFT_129774 [Colletotrichum godetiae]KAK1700390.1 hypothetical protein BDP55DRAFT_129774 [Colletotrichum godetiae]